MTKLEQINWETKRIGGAYPLGGLIDGYLEIIKKRSKQNVAEKLIRSKKKQAKLRTIKHQFSTIKHQKNDKKRI